MSTTPEPFRYVDADQFCLSARLLPGLDTGALSISIEGDEPQSVRVPAADLPQILAGLAGVVGTPEPTNPAAAVEVRDRCPHCGDPQLVPRVQMAEHLARLHPEEPAVNGAQIATDAVLAAAIPSWEAVYEPGNVSDYLIGYANTEAAAKGAAVAWVLSQSDKDAARLEWEEQPTGERHDRWFDLTERHDDGVDTATGVTVRRRSRPYTADDVAASLAANQPETEGSR